MNRIQRLPFIEFLRDKMNKIYAGVAKAFNQHYVLSESKETLLGKKKQTHNRRH